MSVRPGDAAATQDTPRTKHEAEPRAGQLPADTATRIPYDGPAGILVPQRGRPRGPRRGRPHDLW